VCGEYNASFVVCVEGKVLLLVCGEDNSLFVVCMEGNVLLLVCGEDNTLFSVCVEDNVLFLVCVEDNALFAVCVEDILFLVWGKDSVLNCQSGICQLAQYRTCNSLEDESCGEKDKL